MYGYEQVVPCLFPGPVFGQVQVEAAGVVGKPGGHVDDLGADGGRAGGAVAAGCEVAGGSGQRGRRAPESLYGSLKMWAHLQRLGFPVARCTVERLMREHGWRGVNRARAVRTTVADPAAARAPDLVNRCFTTDAPDSLWVADLTHVPLAGGGFGYTAFVIDAFAGYIPGRECALTKHTRFVESALRQAVALWTRQGHPVGGDTIHHSDAGSQGGFSWSSQHLDYGGLRWGAARSRHLRCRVVRGASGRRIGHCDRRCGRRDGRSRIVRCSGTLGGGSRRE
jgi:putative transposase